MLEELVKVALGQSNTHYGVSVWAPEYEKLGWHVLQLPFGVKRVKAKGWSTLSKTPVNPNHTGNIGLLHDGSGTCSIDIDMLPEAIEWLASVGVDLKGLLSAPDAVRIESGNGGHGKLIYRLETPLRSVAYKMLGADGKPHHVVDFRSYGRQDVLPPSIHPDTREPYRWAGDFTKLPMLPEGLLGVWQGLLIGWISGGVGSRAPGDATKAVQRLKVVEDRREQALEALEFIDPDVDMLTWVKVGMALQMMNGTWEDWDEWSSHGAKYQGADETLVRWNSFSPREDGVGPGTLLGLAKEGGWVMIDREATPPVEEQFIGVETAPVPPGAIPLDDIKTFAEKLRDLPSDASSDVINDLVDRLVHCKFDNTAVAQALASIKQRTGVNLSTLKDRLKATRKRVRETGVCPAVDNDPLFPLAGRLDAIESIKRSLVCASSEGEEMQPLNIQGNVDIIVKQGCGMIYPKLRMNEVTEDVMMFDTNGALLEYPGDPVAAIHGRATTDFKCAFTYRSIEQACELTMATEEPYNPLREYFESLPPADPAIVMDFAVEVWKTEDTEYNRLAGALLLCSAVDRALHRGCQNDSMIVLEGIQGCGKSSSVRLLPPDPSYYVTTHIRPSDKNVDMYMIINRRWFVEFGELAGFGKADAESLKTLISTAEDTYRAPYAKRELPHPRGCVFVGTTNQDVYLFDDTGNRRFFPVKCGDEIDLDLLVKKRDVYWASAYAMLKNGQGSSYPIYSKIKAIAEPHQVARLEVDPWAEEVQRIMMNFEAVGRTQVSSLEILIQAGYQPKDCGSPTGKRLRRAMKCLSNWEYGIVKPDLEGVPGDRRVNGYRKI